MARTTTHWPEIRDIELRIEAGDPAPLTEFVRLLAERGLLGSGMPHGLIETSLDPHTIRKRWAALRDMVAKKEGE